MDCSMSGHPVHHKLPEFNQTHVHWVGDTIQPSHPLSSPSPSTSILSQHYGFSSESVIHIRWPKYWVSASASVLPVNIQHWFPLGWTGWISFQSKGLSRVFSNTIVQKHQFFSTQLSLQSNSHIHTWLLEAIALTRWTFVGKVIFLLFNTLSRFVNNFSSMEQGSFNFMAAITICDFGAQENKVCHCFHCFPICLPWSDRIRCHDLSFLKTKIRYIFYT